MKTLIVAAAILGTAPAFAPAFAQNAFTTTQSPPSGNSSQSTPNTTNSLPKASGTERPTEQPGSAIGEARTQPAPTARRPVARAKARPRHSNPAG